jgi:hypothetical protein
MRATATHHRDVLTMHTVESLWELVESYCYDIAESAQVKSALREFQRQEYNRGVEAAITGVKDCHFLQATNNQNHPSAFHDGVDAAIAAILALKEPTP